MKDIIVNLTPAQFSDVEKTVLEYGNFKVGAFTYSTGVCALRLTNGDNELVILPYQGQQVWRARMGGHDLTMRTGYDEPKNTDDFMLTYGGFLLHCGATAMGNPSPEDTHPQHGEMPNMRYDSAYIRCGEDEKGNYVAIGGKRDYYVAFTARYLAQPEIRLYDGATTAEVTMRVTNLRTTPMDFIYLCHINFRPFDGTRLVWAGDVAKVYRDVPETFTDEAKARLNGYLDRLEADPSIHTVIDSATQCYHPEVVFRVNNKADGAGVAHCMAVLPDETAYYVNYRVAELPVGVRWIARTGDEDSLGMLLPATAEHLGMIHARKTGQVELLPAGGVKEMKMTFGLLDKETAAKTEAMIKALI